MIEGWLALTTTASMEFGTSFTGTLNQTFSERVFPARSIPDADFQQTSFAATVAMGLRLSTAAF